MHTHILERIVGGKKTKGAERKDGGAKHQLLLINLLQEEDLNKTFSHFLSEFPASLSQLSRYNVFFHFFYFAVCGSAAAAPGAAPLPRPRHPHPANATPCGAAASSAPRGQHGQPAGPVLRPEPPAAAQGREETPRQQQRAPER